MPALSNFLGSDYIDRLDGNGPVAVRSLMGRFVDSQDDTEREMILEELEITKKWNRNDQRLAGGNFDIGKIQTAKCRIKSTGHEAIAIRIECIPSMKSEPYWVMLVVDCTTQKLVPPPTSRCGCPAGLGGCSHLRGEYAILFYLQKLLKQRQLHSETLTREDAVSLLPPPMATMKKVPIPFGFAFQDDDAEKELKKERRRRERDNRNRQSNITSH